MKDNFNISVIIPTRNRPALVSRAVMSALTQTASPLEVIVVIDGPDDATVKALEQIKDARLAVLALPKNVGGSDARNAGVKAAKGEWIALLDDDDEWLPEKLAKQIGALGQMHDNFPVLSSYIIARTPSRDFVWPTRIPGPDEHISEYILTRNSLFYGEGILHTSTLLAKKKMFEMIPFHTGLKMYQDWDWVLRAARVDGVCFNIVREPLAICGIDEDERKSVGTQSRWEYSLEWIRENRNLVTPRAYSGFIATSLSAQAAHNGEWRAFFPLLREMFRIGTPTIFHLSLFLGMWFVPQNLRRKARAFFRKSPEGASR